jgi:hypothetical protein
MLAQTAIIANHNTVDLTLIPDAALSPAANLRVMLRRASVGGNISDGLDTLQTKNAKYNRIHWEFQDRGNPGWAEKLADFTDSVTARQANFDILSMKFCWIDPDANFATYRDTLLRLESRYPNKWFVWWTMPIMNSANVDGDESKRQVFNDSVRAFATTNKKLLFDIADIEAYNAAGQKKTDGSGNELQQDAWSKLDGGHLNTAGSRRVASAWWWLMARVAGWNGTTDVEKKTEGPQVFNVLQNYPNPFNPTTTIEFTLAKNGKVLLKVFDILGHEVATLVDKEMQAGSLHRILFDASRLSSGVYFYRLEADNNVQVKKIMLMK